jgi:hypothetical protein
MFVFERQEKLLRRGPHLLKYSERYANETPQQTPYLTQDFSRFCRNFAREGDSAMLLPRL